MCPTGTSVRISGGPTGTSEFRRAFEVIDFDHDGKISGEDLKSFYASISGNDDDEEMIKAMIKVADKNNDGYVEYDEFEKVLEKKGKMKRRVEGGEGVMEEVFKVMDKDGDGKLGVDDLKSYLRWAGIEVGDDEIKAMIKLGNDNVNDDYENNGVTFDGFVNILAVHDFVC